MKTLKKLLHFLSPSDKKRAFHLMALILMMALLEMIGVASILPFLAVLSNPQIIETNFVLNKAFSVSQKIGISTVTQFLFALGIFVFLLLISSLAFKALTVHRQIGFALKCEYNIGKCLIEGYLRQPYSWFLQRHSADLGKTILSEVATVISKGMVPFMTIVAQATVTTALLITLILVDTKLALSVGIILGMSYTFLSVAMNRWLKRLGQARVKANQERYTAVSEAFGAAKEIKLGGLEQAFVQRFATPAEIYAKGQATALVIAQWPRYGMEALAFGGLLLLILYMMADNYDFSNVLPIIGLYAFTGYKLMPAVQQIYQSFTNLIFAGPAVDNLYQEFVNLDVHKLQKTLHEPLPLRNSIKLKQVCYKYQNSPHSVLNSIDICIPAHSKVGFVGTTGSGKTTTIDIILGLLEPQKGTLSIDGTEITEKNRRNWQQTIGYVPQQIFLTDGNVAENIAFGVDPAEIDQIALERAAKIANLYDFITNELPDGFLTTVGERGVRLSGGQRQRVGIARALYHNPQVLILDEATSALDNSTEKDVIDEINNLGHDVTIIFIAHRLTTVRYCDQIFLLDKGMVKAKGSFEELIMVDPEFAAMAEGLT